jgi:hypothetical protein
LTKVELLELAVGQGIDPLAALRAELIIGKVGATVGAGVFAQPDSFRRPLLCHALMVLWAIRTAETWQPAQLVGVLVLAAAILAGLYLLLRSRRDRL